MGLLKQFLDTRKTKNQTALSLEEENKQLKTQIEDLQTQLRQKEVEHAEEIAFIDREFLTWYSKQNTTIDKQNISLNSQTGELNREKDNQEPLDLETQTEDLEIGDLIND